MFMEQEDKDVMKVPALLDILQFYTLDIGNV